MTHASPSSAPAWRARSAPGSSRGAATGCGSSRCGPKVGTSAHQTDRCAELVCSNSFRSDNPRNAVGLLKREMEALDSLVIRSARAAAVPAGRRARDGPPRLRRASSPRRSPSRPEIELVREEVRAIPDASGFVVIATGPLTSPALDRAIGELLGTRGPLLLRLDGADRRGLLARLLEDVRALALRKGRRRGLLELSAHARGVRAIPRRAALGRDGRRSRTSRRASTSRAASRSRSWPSGGARRCATGR